MSLGSTDIRSAIGFSERRKQLLNSIRRPRIMIPFPSIILSAKIYLA